MIETPPIVKSTPEKVTPLKVSEALRLGAMVSKQMKGSLKGKIHGEVYACAVGAAGIGFGWKRGFYTKFEKLTLDDVNYSCPVDDLARHAPGYHRGSLKDVVIHMNDVHRLPREWIADWLESVGY